MEEQIRKLAGPSVTGIKEVRVVRGKELQAAGMNLFYAVG